MSRFGVTPQKEADLAARMAALGLREDDIDERFVTSGGPGGQKVNRSNTCVQLMHRPTGIEVKMQRARSQALNRFLARRRLCELVENRALGAESPEALRREKARKQKARRMRRARGKAAVVPTEAEIRQDPDDDRTAREK
ncbi:MAG TPA: peptide chain release factor-like protein [Candidatus Hydrogenedentes bacterium]|nr:peptide chain release factor-like protein [Candidatus Hydrogenedentota bacterium]HNT87446.1 peptide chain release factor-like protein [Candidatus Hydrogenedentota bacterium]